MKCVTLPQSKIPARAIGWLIGMLLLSSFFTTGAAETVLSPVVPRKARILLVTGIDYPCHLWRQTAPVLA